MSDLYSTVKNYTPKDIPQPVLDDNPSEDDIKYMQQAYQVAKKSPDESTQVKMKKRRRLFQNWLILC